MADMGRIMWAVMMVTLAAGVQGSHGANQGNGQAPLLVLTTLNTNPDPAAGPLGSALSVLDVERGHLHVFPFLTMEGGPVTGQAMHTALTPDNRKVYVTMGGNRTLPLRMVVIDLTWRDRIPSPRVIKSLEMVPSGTPGNEANGASCHPGMPGIRQEGHGMRITADGRFLTVSELQNDRVHILDTATDRFVGPPMVHRDLVAPHGLYPNPAGTLAAAPQYWFDQNGVSVWNIEPENGALSYHSTVRLEHEELRGAYLHTVRWLDDQRFFTNATQERHQGDGSSEQAVWLVDLEQGTTRAVLDADDILEGVSDVELANGKLYVAEGNVAQLLAGEQAPGYLSVWSLEDPSAPTFLRRLSAGEGLPETFSNAHGLAASADGRHLFVESFSSNFLIEVDTNDDSVARVFSGADKLNGTHVSTALTPIQLPAAAINAASSSTASSSRGFSGNLGVPASIPCSLSAALTVAGSPLDRMNRRIGSCL